MAGFGYEWDEAKRAANLGKHGLDFAAIELFDWAAATVLPDTRVDYGEARFRAYGMLEGRPFVVVFTRRGAAIRLISLRCANARERKRHGH